MKKFILLIIANFAFGHSIDGYYMVPNFLIFKGAYVYVYEKDNMIYAYGVANLDNSPAKKDTCNPDKALRERSDKGTIFLTQLEIDETHLKNGMSYNFQDCHTYHTKGEILPNNDLRLSFSLDPYFVLSKSFVWQRLDEEKIKELGLTSINELHATK